MLRITKFGNFFYATGWLDGGESGPMFHLNEYEWDAGWCYNMSVNYIECS